MKGITKLKINQFKIKQLGYDFMGFTIKRLDECTAHHLIIPARHKREFWELIYERCNKIINKRF